METDQNKTKELRMRLVEMPQAIQELIRSGDIEDFAKGSGLIHDLSEEQIMRLENEIVLTLLAYDTFESFRSRLISVVEVDEIKANALAKAAQDLVFIDVEPELEAIKKATAEHEQAIAKNNPIGGATPPPIAGATPPADNSNPSQATHTPVAPYKKPFTGVEKQNNTNAEDGLPTK